MAEWITEGCAERSATRIMPLVHLLVESSDIPWRMWCSAGAGIKQTTLRVPGNPPRYCPACRKLAQEAVNEGTLSADDLPGWNLLDQDEARP